ncbi:MAG TPA: DNA polymerase III subunit gamma/tau [Caulobacteraceae bacterium]|jgi:DNA polymerase-3 subunit gamma/tau|nr:DNA polymerase III subunit gamma/tau [Caulobacteraceae bacterium]
MTDLDLTGDIGLSQSDGEPAPDGPPERDEATVDIFGAAPSEPPAEPSAAYTVIARKYRPRSFADLIGQEAMVRTLTNAFATGRIAHAFMLTGVRGVGKTTTARLLARALNYESDTIHQPDLEHLAVEGRHCRGILEGRHLDVLELDAASRTGIDDIRELTDAVRYAPAEARYKVYILDEIHMLSEKAFNALLKTLEEPPPHAKFIFATTEIRKVPVTILSRCQRFDLRRVESEVIGANLAAIAEKEGYAVEADALTLMARAAEGSVRDGQSLLDQALVQAEPGQPVSAAAVRDMLGLSDRGLTLALIERLMGGDAPGAVQGFRELYAVGADPATVTLDLLEHVHAATMAKALGPDVLQLPKDQAQRLAALGAGASNGSLSRLWQLLLKGLEEVRAAPDPAAAVDMLLIRLAYAADLPGPEQAIEWLRSGRAGGPPGPPASGGGGGPSGGGSAAGGSSGGGSGGAMVRTSGGASMAMPAPANPAAASPVVASFEDLAGLADARRDIALRFDIERYVRPIGFRPGAVAFEPAPGAPGDLAQRIAARLKEWTGQPWLVAAEGGAGAETLAERRRSREAADHEAALAEPFVQAMMEAFPGVELVEVRRKAMLELVEASPDDASDEDDDDQ